MIAFCDVGRAPFHHRWRRETAAWGLIAAFSATVVGISPMPAAWAQTAEDKQQARILAEEGAKAFDRGDYPMALDNLSRAYELVPVPTIGIEVARTLDALDRLVEAVDAYRRVEDAAIDPAMPPKFAAVQRRTQEQARAERIALEAEQPRVHLEGLGDGDVTVAIDGAPVSLDPASPTFVVDPGRHEVVARRGDAIAQQGFEIARGEQQTVRLVLPAEPVLPSAPLPRAPDPPMNAPRAPAPSSTWQDEGATSALAISGWTILAAGGVAAAVGVGLYAHAASLEDDLARRCPSGTCRRSLVGPAVEDDIASYDRIRVGSAVALGLGAGLAALGTTLLVIDLVGEDDTHGAARLVVTPSAVGMGGSF